MGRKRKDTTAEPFDHSTHAQPLQRPGAPADRPRVKRPAPVILVIDDEAEVRHLFSEILEASGFGAAQAPTAEEAWVLLERGLVPSGVLLDLRMPGMGGLGFLLQLRADARFALLPVSIVTGESFIDQTTRAAVTALGAVVTFKPLDIDEVVGLATQMTSQASASRSTLAKAPRARKPARPKRPDMFQK